ncbi:MAG TPA: hypothetical protein DD490_27605, partial [Acidobacteria bacterium]|nr:hypothetical protein [Acidobacteriota bacterium]
MWRAEIDGRTLRFHLTGINNQNFLMQDEQTGSWWQQVTGEALFGPLKGRTLDLVHHDEISFGLWKREQPGGRVLRPDDGAPWREFSHDWEAETAKLPVVTPERPGDPFDPRELVAGIALPGASKAYSVARLRRESPVLDTLAGVPLLLVVGEDGRSLRVFDRRIDGRTLDLFARPGGPPLVLLDAETGSTWSFAGEALSGPLAGRRLTRVSR